MRLRAVFLYGGLAALSAAAAAGDIRICSTLEEALPPPGRPALVVFFSPACPACYEELFELRHFIGRNGLPAALIGVAAGAREDLEEFCGKFRLDDPVVSDPRRKIHRRFGVDLLPWKLVLVDGRIVYRDAAGTDVRRRLEEVKRCLRELGSG